MVAIIYDKDGNILETISNVRRSHKLADTYHAFKGGQSKIWLIKFVDRFIEVEK